ILDQSKVINKMPGNSPWVKKAYGPWEAVNLRQRDPALAKRNNENATWQRPQSATNKRDFLLADSNDIPNSYKQIGQGVVKNI
ncbi:MAG: hypothetical protein Q9184_007869, partial [Pyrenodesmia sp. 2 TL-2023]